ncbi:phage tail protein I [Acinetobacter sp. WCHAc060033]|uniref:phage tail protein I n=1 Tax=Acinetobacter sp. WCHAc060033 TaxID=2518624 RepID=UPI0010239676|nr:phage tail protein I [Acinetobacter sp. WCHAc060033]RZG78349.1 phage tail protein I [Acinetobacter sp. WCHAc060033]
MRTLLPPNSTLLERNIAEINKDAFNLPSIRVIKDLDNVPTQFLPFIAWQKSVDYWDDNWQEGLKRKVIKQSKEQHKLKGTAAAIRKALEPFGYEVNLIEWFKATPNLTPGTFNLELDLIGKSLTAEVYYEVRRLVSDAKAASRHLANLTITSNPILTTKNTLVHQTALTFTSLPRN